jgi:hypothetical protein
MELLRRLNPIRHERVTDEDEAQLAATLRRGSPGSNVQPLPSRRNVAAAALVVAAVLATAAWVVLRREEVTNPLQVACHRTASAVGDLHVVPMRGDPVSSCAPLWIDGTFGNGPPGRPPLTACTNAGGTAAVFPGGAEVCASLGLAQMAPPATGDLALRELETRLQLIFGPACVARADAPKVIESVLHEMELDDWSITLSAPLNDARPCAATEVDARERKISIAARTAQPLVPPASVKP